MTSSQDPPLTRREARERERLLQAQREAQTTDAAPAPTPPAPPPTPAPAVPPTPYPGPAAAPAPPVQPSYPVPQPASPSRAQTPTYGDSFGQQAPPSWPQPPAQGTTPERTLTRRELRAMLEGHSDEFDDLDDGPVLPAPATSYPAPAPASPPAASVPPRLADSFPPQPAPAREPAPHQVAESAIADEPTSAPKPVGHWTAQLNAPIERAEPFDQLLSRGSVSHGIPTTTNALILPSLPDHGQMGSGMNSAEVIVTGSIDLPRSYGATGVHPSQIDSSDVDRLFDQVEDGAGVGAPVAATRAISTQAASKAMMAPPKKEGMNVPLVLAVTAGVLALGVVATLVIGAVAGLF